MHVCETTAVGAECDCTVNPEDIYAAQSGTDTRPTVHLTHKTTQINAALNQLNGKYEQNEDNTGRRTNNQDGLPPHPD